MARQPSVPNFMGLDFVLIYLTPFALLIFSLCHCERSEAIRIAVIEIASSLRSSQ